MNRFASARFIRRFGFSVALWSVALAALVDSWAPSFLLGMLALGIGIGLGDWKGGDIGWMLVTYGLAPLLGSLCFLLVKRLF